MTDIRLERAVYAPLDWVVRAWWDPQLLVEWFSPDPSVSAMADLDVGPGGVWRVMMGTSVARGEYTEVDLPHRLVFTWRWEDEPDDRTLVRVTFTERSEQSTELLLEHLDFDSGEDADEHQQMWSVTLDRLAQMIQSRASGYSPTT